MTHQYSRRGCLVDECPKSISRAGEAVRMMHVLDHIQERFHALMNEVIIDYRVMISACSI